MKTQLTAEQSAKLIELGVSPERASETRIDFNGRYAYVCGEEAQLVRDCVNSHFYVEECRIFTLADICALLPKEIVTDTIMCENDVCPLSVRWDKNCHLVDPINPIGYLRHDPTGYSLAVYKPISRFHALMLRWCFGVKYYKI